MRPSWLGAPLAASVFVHATLGLRIYTTPLGPPKGLDRDLFVVRTVELAPPPAPAAKEPPPPLPESAPKPEPVKVPPAKAPPKPTAPKPTAAPPEAKEAAPEPVTAPEALLAAGPHVAGGGIVQVPGAALGAWATSSLDPPTHQPAPVLAGASRAFTKLSDLSRKPRAPALDAALRDNYPLDQRRRGVEGQAEVHVMIERNGRVGEIQVISESSAGFAEACRRTLRGSSWSEPLGRDGHPVRTRLTYRCRFRIER